MGEDITHKDEYGQEGAPSANEWDMTPPDDPDAFDGPAKEEEGDENAETSEPDYSDLNEMPLRETQPGAKYPWRREREEVPLEAQAVADADSSDRHEADASAHDENVLNDDAAAANPEDFDF